MIPKGKTTYLLLILFILMVTLSTLGLFFFKYFDTKKQTVSNQKLLLLRNKYLLKDIAYNTARIETEATEAKENIKRSVLLYRLSYGVFFNGGNIPEITNNQIIPPADENYRKLISKIKPVIESIRKLSEYIIETPYYIYVSNPEITIDNTQKQKNKLIIKSISKFQTILHKAETINNDLIFVAQEQYKKHDLNQEISLILILILIIITIIFLWILLNKKVFVELKVLATQMSNPKNAFNEIEIDYSNYFFKDLFKNFYEFRQILPGLSTFVKKLYDRELETKPDDAIKETPLYENLTMLRNDLQNRRNQEKERQKIETIRQWSAAGHNEITKILQSAGTISDLADKVIVGLVKYLGAAQGGVFLLKDKQSKQAYLELTAAFAYDRKKFLTKTIPVGEGLLGMAALEKTTYWLDDIPKDYLEIESGLGGASPRSLIIVPLQAENEMSGIVEIASLNKFKQHEVDFIKEIAQNIGSALRSVQITEQTASLLEESRKKSEELAIQDTKMRKRFDELIYAQHLAKKNEQEMSALVNVIDKNLLKCEINLECLMEDFNRNFLNLTDFYKDELKSKDFRMLLFEKDIKNFDQNINIVFKKQSAKLTAQIKTKFGHRAWIFIQMIPLMDNENNVKKVLLIGNDISKQKKKEIRTTKLLEETIKNAEKLTKENQKLQTGNQ